MTRVSILGCGWLGWPLGAFLHNHTFLVTGSTTSPDKLQKLINVHINPVLLNLQPTITAEQQRDWENFLQTDILIINIPPKIQTQGTAFHVQQIQQVIHSLGSSSAKVIYISSTSVYPDTIPVVTETSAIVDGNSMVMAENLLKEKIQHITILRCGGLMGYDRIPGKYVTGKPIQTGNIPVNFVHRDDVIRIIYEVIRQERWNTIYNVVAPQHPLRHEIYTRNCQDFNYPPPIYDDSKVIPFKIVSGKKMEDELQYEFLYPDPLMFRYG